MDNGSILDCRPILHILSIVYGFPVLDTVPVLYRWLLACCAVLGTLSILCCLSVWRFAAVV